MSNAQHAASCPYRKTIAWGGVGFALSAALLSPSPAWGSPAAIGGITAAGASAAGHAPELAVDGDPSTYWESPTQTR